MVLLLAKAGLGVTAVAVDVVLAADNTKQVKTSKHVG